jgi:hypothetical protein
MAATDGKLPVMMERLAAMVSSPFAAVARAEPYYAFQSPSANVYCGLGQADVSTFAVCEIRDHTWAAPPRPTPCMGDWGDRISIRQGGAPQMSCHTDTLKDPASPVLEYGQTRVAQRTHVRQRNLGHDMHGPRQRSLFPPRAR